MEQEDHIDAKLPPSTPTTTPTPLCPRTPTHDDPDTILNAAKNKVLVDGVYLPCHRGGYGPLGDGRPISYPDPNLYPDGTWRKASVPTLWEAGFDDEGNTIVIPLEWRQVWVWNKAKVPPPGTKFKMRSHPL